MEMEENNVEMEKPSKWQKFKNKKIAIFSKSLPVTIFALFLVASTTIAAVVWVLTQTTWIYIAPYETPYLEPQTYTIRDAVIGATYPYDFTIFNPNEVPLLVSSKWIVWVDGVKVGEGYTVDQLQQFLYARQIVTSPEDDYGCDDEFCSNLVIPPLGRTTYTLVYHLPPTYKIGETKYYTDENNVVQIDWKPTVSVWDEQLWFDGSEAWVNPFVPTWYS